MVQIKDGFGFITCTIDVKTLDAGITEMTITDADPLTKTEIVVWLDEADIKNIIEALTTPNPVVRV
jgi:hypothetical protein